MKNHSRECPVCYGTGEVAAGETLNADGSGVTLAHEKCSACNGSGEVNL